MFKLNEIQKKFVELALKVFNKDTLTRADIKTLVKDHGQSWPSWLIRNFRVDRGSYKLPTSDSDFPTNPDSEPKAKVLSDNSETKKEAAYIVSSLVDNGFFEFCVFLEFFVQNPEICLKSFLN